MSVKTFTGSKIRRNIVGCAENCRVVVVRLGKIKCAANWVGLWVALQPFLFCEGMGGSSLNFAFIFSNNSVYLLVVILQAKS